MISDRGSNACSDILEESFFGDKSHLLCVNEVCVTVTLLTVLRFRKHQNFPIYRNICIIIKIFSFNIHSIQFQRQINIDYWDYLHHLPFVCPQWGVWVSSWLATSCLSYCPMGAKSRLLEVCETRGLSYCQVTIIISLRGMMILCKSCIYLLYGLWFCECLDVYLTFFVRVISLR